MRKNQKGLRQKLVVGDGQQVQFLLIRQVRDTVGWYWVSGQL